MSATVLGPARGGDKRDREDLAHFSEVCDRVGYYMVQTLRCKQQIKKRELEKQMQLAKKNVENHHCNSAAAAAAKNQPFGLGACRHHASNRLLQSASAVKIAAFSIGA